MDRPAFHAASLAIAVIGVVTVLTTTTVVALAGTKQEAFAAENGAAMNKMMKAMDIRPSGNVDVDFATMMIPHHQGAIDMAVAELRYGSNEQLRRIAQGIVVEQQQEIAAMRLALDQALPAPTASPSRSGSTSVQAAHPD